MFSTHLVLISTNQTTVEHLASHTTKDRESDMLDEMYSCCAFRFVLFFFLLFPMHLYELSFIGWLFRAKWRTRQAWDTEYGRIGREANMWWLGTVRANWEQVFGPRTWTWFRESFPHPLPHVIINCLLVPIGSMKDKGLDYPQNPRFNADGQWLPRRQWPSSLR